MAQAILAQGARPCRAHGRRERSMDVSQAEGERGGCQDSLAIPPCNVFSSFVDSPVASSAGDVQSPAQLVRHVAEELRRDLALMEESVCKRAVARVREELAPTLADIRRAATTTTVPHDWATAAEVRSL